MTPLLEVRELTVSYGPIVAVRDVTLEVSGGEIVALVGANGAGKSSLVRGVLGMASCKSDTVRGPDGIDLRSLPAHRVVRTGIGVVPERRRVFGAQTVEENLLLGAYHTRERDEVERQIQWVYDLFPRLHDRCLQRAGTLSGGEQQMLAVGRALMSSPRLMIMDEPSLGLAPIIIDDLFATFREIAEDGVGILLVEENVSRALDVADRGLVLEVGAIVAEGTPSELLADPDFDAAFLG